MLFPWRKKKYANNWKDNYHIVDKWKVVMAKADGGAYSSSQISEESNPCRGIQNIFIISPNEICTDTYLIINYFNSKVESENFVKYITTKFVKFLIGSYNSSQNFTRSSFSFVPDMEDYTKEWIDQELYEMFELTQEEIDFIEEKII